MIREYSSGDIAPLHKILSDPVTMSYWPEPFSPEQTQLWVERSIESCNKNGFGRFALIKKTTGEFIGTAGIMISEVNGKNENDLGYIIYFPFWNSGYATEAAGAILCWGIDSIGLARISANMAVDNTASARVAQKIGMTIETEFLNRRNRDKLTFLYSLSKH